MHLLVKMRFRRAMVQGNFDSDLGIIHSDTLFSGIANQWAKIPAPCSIDDLVTALNSLSPPFRISSAFPFMGTEFYLPTPCGLDDDYMDTLKDIPFLELEVLLKLAEGNRNHLSKIPLDSPVAEFLYSFISPRVGIDRLTNMTNVYDINGLTFSQGSGLYFIIDLQDEKLRETLELCIRMLGDAGIGGDRSLGFGVFDADTHPVTQDSLWAELFQPRSGVDMSHYTLSLCCPFDPRTKKPEGADDAISYTMVSRGGWTLSSSSFKQTKRRECRMLSEGSLFRAVVRGCIADVTPDIFRKTGDHDIYRYGLGMWIAGAW